MTCHVRDDDRQRRVLLGIWSAGSDRQWHDKQRSDPGARNQVRGVVEATMTTDRRYTGVGSALVAFVYLTGCAPQVTLTPLGDGGTYPATPESAPIPLYATTAPECPYDEIAAITAEGTGEAKVLSALVSTARGIGAHAILGYKQGNRAASAGSSTTDVHVRGGTAIRFRSVDCTR